MRDLTARKKTSPRCLPSAPSVAPPRALVACPRAASSDAGEEARPIYAAFLAHARAAGIFALCTIAPLGALAGLVSACGAAAPVRPSPAMQVDPNAQVAPPTGAGTQPAPLTSIAPPTTNMVPTGQ